jgi:chromosome segregation ATPase
MAPALGLPGRFPLVLAALALLASGCQLAPRAQLDECHRLSQTLRSENAHLKDQMLALRSDNQDFSERAVDDARRLAQLEAVNQRLETSVQAYQDERTRLESAYKELLASLPGSLKPVSMDVHKKDESGTDRPASKTAAAVHQLDPEVSKASEARASEARPEVKARPQRKTAKRRAYGGWAPARSDHHGSQNPDQDLNLNLNQDAPDSARSTSPHRGS